jgi:hypothetical protein
MESFETFPIPANDSKMDAVMNGIASQHELLMPVVTKLFAAVDSSLASQQKVLNGVSRKLATAVGNRLKNQAALIQPSVDSLYSAVDGAIAQQGNQIAVQSAVLSRLAPVGVAPPLTPQQPQTPTSPPIIPGGVRGGTPVTLAGSSLPPGVSAPSSSLSPQQILPAGSTPAPFTPVLPNQPAPPTTTNPAPQPITPPNWMVLADCSSVMNWTVLDQNDPLFPTLIANGSYVPLRKDFGADFNSAVAWARYYSGVETPAGGLLGQNTPVSVACFAWNNGGSGWPTDGDFGSSPPPGAIPGNPVGDWPFNSSGQYIGP